ncbi:MAG: bifunctional aspartate kinase/homoserine dehydrogenase I [Woeseiaceae bacterium]
MAGNNWKIHKFGGSSLANAACYQRVADIISSLRQAPTGVVVSAMGGMTNSLLALVALAERGDGHHAEELLAIGARYTETAEQLVSGSELVHLLDSWGQDAKQLEDLLGAMASTKSASLRTRDIVAGFGEIWSARLLAALLKQSLDSQRAVTWIDAREVIAVRHGDLGPAVIWDVSRENMARQLESDFDGVAVMTGFIAVDEEGLQTTLGRNGSDYSAAIFAALTDATELDIWTDVDGVMSADPRRVPDAQIIHSLSYNEAMELAYFGAKVIHPQTLGPAVDNGIAVVIRNSFQPDHPGSRITAVVSGDEQIKGITAVGGMALINLEGAGMIGVPGTADRLFASLKDAGVSVSLISQASSEHSICIAVPADLADLASKTVSHAFAEELDGGQIQSVDVTDEQSIIAVVGDGMAGSPGIAARFFANLGRAGINVRAIAQGSSERNISAVVDSQDVTRALRAVHSGFYLSAKTISVGVIGAGIVGGTFLDQVHQQTQRLHEKFDLDLRVRAIARSSRMLLGERRIALHDWRRNLDSSEVPVDFDAFEAHVHAEHLPHAVIIDCTADDAIAERYAGWLARGIHVITPNKKAFSGRQSDYEAIRAAADEGRSHYFYETTVGAALPIIKTIRDLVDTGDRIHSIKGILSGTLAYLFNVYDGTKPFSEIVIEARASGYTEPDPRDDLSGMDVARKLTILAREMGQTIEIGDFPVQNLIPEALRDSTVEEFLERLAEYDDDMLSVYQSAQAEGKQLRYIATLDALGNAEVGLQRVAADDAFSNMQLTDNLVQFITDRYAQNPLVIQGPGAGPEVTAGGVFGDLLRLASFLNDGINL